MHNNREIKHYVTGDKIVVVDEWMQWDEKHGIRAGEIYTCLNIMVDEGIGIFTAIDNGTCEENGKIVDGYLYERFDKAD